MQRPLGGFEHALWLYDQVHPLHFCMCARITGEFSVDQFRRALGHVQQRHALLRVRIDVAENGRPVFVEDAAEIPVRVASRTNDQQWQSELEAELSRSFNPANAPLARVVLLQSPGTSDLIVTLAHTLSDGMSGACVVRDIVRALDTDALPAHALADALPLEAAAPIEYGTGPVATTATSSASRVPRAIASTRTRPHVRTALLSSALTQALCDRCHEEHTTVHAAVCAAFLLTLREQRTTAASDAARATALTCLSPIDVRPHLTASVRESAGLYIGFGLTKHELTDEADFWDVARSLRSQLSESMTLPQLFGILAPREAMMATCPPAQAIADAMQQQYANDVLVTNIGLANIGQQFGQLRIDALYGPIVMTGIANERIVGVVTLGNRLSLALAAAAIADTATNASATVARSVHHIETAVQPANQVSGTG